jgi:hypothetical protein
MTIESRLMCALVLGAGALGCGAQPMQASADWERGVDFQSDKTFCVERSPWIPKDLTPEQAALLEVAERTTKEQLAKKGYRESPRDQARLVATPYFIKRKRDDVMVASTYCGAYDATVTGKDIPAGLVGSCEESYITEFDEGTLLVDLYDAQRDQLIWHGWTSTEWPKQGAQAANTPTLVERAMIDILDRFPP